MIKEDAVAGVQPIELAVVFDDPEAILLGDRIGRARIERCCFRLRDLHHLPVEFRCRGLVKATIHAGFTDSVEQAQYTDRIGFGSVFRNLERHLHAHLKQGAEQCLVPLLQRVREG